MHPDSDGFVTRAAALAAGYTDSEFSRSAADGKLCRIGPGVYYPSSKYAELSPVDVHRVRSIAAVRDRSGHAVSHVSAAAMHGLTMWNTDLTRVHLTVDRATGGRRTSVLHIHTSRLGSPDVTTIGSATVTTAARTVVDTARMVDLDHAVVAGDSALRHGLVTPSDLSQVLARSSRLQNVAAARRAVARMNGASESAGESLSRLRMEQFGMPTPVLQHRIPELGYRVDFYWPRFRIVGEFDGMAKYGGRTANLAQEKAREDALRDEGYQVFRWVWKDLWNFADVYMSYRKSCARVTL